MNIDMTPRVTLEGDIILDLTLDNSSLGANVVVAGVSVPSFGQRTVTTRLRLRDGESNLLAGLLREDERKSLTGFPGAIHVPVLKQLFSANDNSIKQTDIVMLLTPHIIRTDEITEDDLKPIYIGSQQNLGVGGPPPLIAPQPEPDPAPCRRLRRAAGSWRDARAGRRDRRAAAGLVTGPWNRGRAPESAARAGAAARRQQPPPPTPPRPRPPPQRRRRSRRHGRGAADLVARHRRRADQS